MLKKKDNTYTKITCCLSLPTNNYKKWRLYAGDITYVTQPRNVGKVDSLVESHVTRILRTLSIEVTRITCIASFYMNPAPKPRPDSVPRHRIFAAVRSGARTAQIGRAALFLQKKPRSLVKSTRGPGLLLVFSKKALDPHEKKVHPPHPGASSLAAYAPTPWQTPAGPGRCVSAARVPAAASVLSLSLSLSLSPPTWWRCSSYYQLVLLERAPLNQYYSTIAAGCLPAYK